ncbi:MAG: uroporphyrinogen-III C-methyltransferase, partial [Limnohabitans sp.]
HDPVALAEPAASAVSVRHWLVWALGAVAVLALVLSVSLWQRLGRMQEQLARQSQDAGQQSLEAKAWAKQAQDTVKDNAARLTLIEGRLGEVALQRGQLEELIQSLSRSRDENLVVDIDSGLRMAQQQAQLTGSTEPLVVTLKSAQQRLQRAAQPRLAPVQRAIEKDLERLRSLQTPDLPGLLMRLDEGVAQMDVLVLANQAPVPSTASAASAAGAARSTWPDWLSQSVREILEPLRGLVRISRVNAPEALLLSPEQAFFLRENLKLKLLNARLGLLSRQYEAARTDLVQTAGAVRRYADPQSRKTQQLLQLLEQAQQQLQKGESPRLDASLAALTTAAAGR